MANKIGSRFKKSQKFLRKSSFLRKTMNFQCEIEQFRKYFRTNYFLSGSNSIAIELRYCFMALSDLLTSGGSLSPFLFVQILFSLIYNIA